MLLAACNKPGNPNKELVERCFAYFNQHQWDAMAALYADTAMFKDPSLGPVAVRQNRKQVADKYRTLQKDIPNVKDEIVKLYAADPDHIVAEFVSKGTLSDGSRLQLPICTIFTIRNGLIVADYTYYDQP
jgi:ketosteroid isomerase-like protein